MERLSRGFIHVHSDNSMNDSAMTIKTLCRKAKELGAPAVALTDHGTLSGVMDFIETAKEYEIKPVLGVEGYIDSKHIVLLAIDKTGYIAICKMMSDAENYKPNGKPQLSKEILEKYMGDGTEGHGHVIISSACMGGIISSIILQNEAIEKKIVNEKKKLVKLERPGNPVYLKMEKQLSDLENKIKYLSSIRNQAKKQAGKSFKTLENKIEKATDEESRIALEKELEEQKKISAKAQATYDSLVEEIALLSRKKTETKKLIKKSLDSQEKYTSLEKNIKELEDKMDSADALKKKAEEEALYYVDLCGDGNFYMELQFHGIDGERKCMPILAEIARKNHIPLLATTDAHMPGNTPDDILARQIMRSGYNGKWAEVMQGDEELYLKTDKELHDSLRCILPEDIVSEAMDNISVVLDRCNAEIKKQNFYPRFKCPNGMTAKEMLRKLALKGKEEKFPNGDGWTEEYEKRFEMELDTMDKMDVNDYHLIVWDLINYGRTIQSIPYDKLDEVPLTIEEAEKWVKEKGYEIGYGIGPGRGSAAGSLICYLIGITSLDPIKHGLLFARYLNLERVSMPNRIWAFDVNSITQRCA